MVFPQLLAGYHQGAGGGSAAVRRTGTEKGDDAPESVRGPRRQGQLKGNLSAWRGSFSRAGYTKWEAKGDGMRPRRIPSLR